MYELNILNFYLSWAWREACPRLRQGKRTWFTGYSRLVIPGGRGYNGECFASAKQNGKPAQTQAGHTARE